jgi:Ca2+-binding EF-hand superfamily protein
MSHRLLVLVILAVWIGDRLPFSMQTAAAQNIVFARGGGAGSAGVAADRDPADPRERYVLLGPGDPLIVELSITIDGRPFRLAREKLVDEYLGQCAKSPDELPIWEPAAAGPRSPLGPLYLRGTDAAAMRELAKQYDVDKDGLVDRAEARRILAAGGDAFTVRDNPLGAVGVVNVEELIDVDRDRVLSREELLAAADRLKSRDADDDDLVTVAEAGGQAPGMYRVVNAAGGNRPQSLALLLGSAGDLPSVYRAIREKYQDPDGILRFTAFPSLPKLVDVLDRNDNKHFDPDEVAGLDSLPPHLVCEVNLGDVNKGNAKKGDTARLTKGITVKSLASELGRVDDVVSRSGDTTNIKLPSVTLSLSASDSVQAYNFDAQAKSVLDRLDTDKNGYLDKNEIAGQQGFAQQFDYWDSNGDGKVYAKEITAAYEAQMAPALTQVNAVVADQGTALFSALDTSGDRRLGIRELRTAGRRLEAFDADADGRITRREIPRQLTVTVGRGNGAYGYTTAPGGFRLVGAPATASGARHWFTSMDRNGDGDLSPREFLGTPEQFRKLDADLDGLIDRREADAAKP